MFAYEETIKFYNLDKYVPMNGMRIKNLQSKSIDASVSSIRPRKASLHHLQVSQRKGDRGRALKFSLTRRPANSPVHDFIGWITKSAGKPIKMDSNTCETPAFTSFVALRKSVRMHLQLRAKTVPAGFLSNPFLSRRVWETL